VLLGPVGPATRAAETPKLDKDATRWLREVRLLILPDEEAFFRGLTNAEDRKEFPRIFWARRDPDPSTPQNELEEAIARAQRKADELFAFPGTRGSETGCGQVFLLLGDPTEVEGTTPGDVTGRGPREQFSSLEAMRQGPRRPETWIYRSRAGDKAELTGGELRIVFDEECRFSEGGRVLDDLRHVAASRITQLGLDYRMTPGGRLVPLAELRRASGQAASPGAARAFLESGRSDFPIAVEPKLLLRTQAGLAYAAGLVRSEATQGGGPGVAGTVAVQAVPSSGPASPVAEKAFTATLGKDGSLVAAWGLPLKAGRYTLHVGLLLSGGKGSVATLPLEVPDFEAPGLKATGLVVYPDETAPADPQDPYAALTVGPLRLRPRFGNVFQKTDSIKVVSVVYGGQADAATGKASLRARFSVSKDGHPVAKSADEAFETATAVASIGPIPLAGFAVGPHMVKLEVTDGVAHTTVVQEAAFEVRE
jgi:GWxTD domain-containing protein